MTTNKLSPQKPLWYGLIGLITGAVLASLIVYNVKPKPPSTVNLSPAPGNTAAREVISPQSSPTSDLTAIPGIPGMMAHSDQHFIVMMIPHHEDAVEMANLALKRAQHPEIKQLAEAIKATQTQEIQQMQAWYQEWYGSEVPVWSPGMGMGMMQRSGTTPSSQRPGMIGRGAMGRGTMGRGSMSTDLNALANATNFDREFIEQMIPHHQMAIMMSTMVANSATRPEIRNLAQSIIRSQSAEIKQMQQWYQAWYSQ
ncbi:MAG: DUF305 domain-containing protein [Leptolyngbyaceae cyanobacterium bins.302]|nr:DUF305 domain-containing protein [Leptolyngbyaceae cyanobacterium bins.302]